MLSSLLVASLTLTSVQLQVGLRQEDRLGIIPLVTTINGVQNQSVGTAKTISGEISPTFTLKLLDTRSELKLSYTPQFLLTHAFGHTNTLTLSSASLAGGYRLSRWTSLFASATGTAGQLDFYRARRQLNPEQATIFTIPENQILSYASVSAFGGLSQQVGKFTRLDFTGLLSHTGPAPGQRSFQFFRQQDSVGGSVRITEQIDRRDSIGLETEYRNVIFQGGPYYTAFTPAIIFDRKAGRELAINAKVGMLFSGTRYGSRQVPEWLVGEGLLPPRTGTERRVMPVLGLSIGGISVRGAGYAYAGRLTANLLPFYDPVQGVLQQRIAFGMGNTFVLSRRYTARFDFSIYVPGKFEFSDTNQPYIDQDVFAILNPVVKRQLTRTAAIEAGALITERLEDYTQVFGNWNRPEIILYLAFSGITTVW